MMKSCPNCGGLFTTKHMEMFAGTPCNCGYKLTVDLCHNDLVEEIRQLKSYLTSTLDLLRKVQHSPVCQSITARDIYQIGIGKCTCGLIAKINEIEELVKE